MDTLHRVIPIIGWAPKYRLSDLQGDIMAGFTVGLTVIPQSIAYASLARLPAEYGLYSAFIGSFIYAIFGTARDITLGPSALQSLLTATFATSPVDGDATYAVLLGFFSGFILLGMHLLGIGAIFDFVSFPVTKAFTTAAAITIAVSQIKGWWGLVGIVPDGFIGNLKFIFERIMYTRLWDFLLGCVCIFFIILFRKLKELKWTKKYNELPLGWKIVKKSLWFIGTARNVLVIIGASVVVLIFSVGGLNPFTVTKAMPPGIPAFRLPAFSLQASNGTGNSSIATVERSFSEITQTLGAGLLILPLLAVLEAMSIGKPYARKGRYRFDTNQELLSYGLANIIGGFCQSIPVTGTFSRTALNAASGVKTPGGGIVTGVIVLLALQFATPVFVYIPSAALAVVIILAVVDTMTFHKVYVFWRTNKIDLIPWIITFVCSFVIQIAYGVLVGVAVSVFILLYSSFRPKTKITNMDVNKADDKILVVKLSSGLVFPAAENFKEKILAKVNPLHPVEGSCKISGIVVDCAVIAAIDSTTVQAWRELMEDLHQKNIPLVLCNLQSQPFRLLQKARPRHLLSAADVDDAVSLVNAVCAEIEAAEGKTILPAPIHSQSARPSSSSSRQKPWTTSSAVPLPPIAESPTLPRAARPAANHYHKQANVSTKPELVLNANLSDAATTSLPVGNGTGAATGGGSDQRSSVLSSAYRPGDLN